MIIKKLFLFLINILIFITLLTFKSSAFDNNEIISLIKKGDFKKAAVSCKDKKTLHNSNINLKGVEALLNYQDPHWHSKDLSLLEKYKSFTYPLIINILKIKMPDNMPKEEYKNLLRVKIKILKALSNLRWKEATPQILNLLKDKNVLIRLNAIKTLKKINNKNTTKALLEYLKTSHSLNFSSAEKAVEISRLEEVARIKAIETIIFIDNNQVIPLLKKDYKDYKSPDRITSVMILTGLRKESLKKLYWEMLKDQNEKIKVYAASTLKDMGDNSGYETLIKIFIKGDFAKKLWISRILSQWRDEKTAKFFLKYLKQESQKGQFGFLPLPSIGKVPQTSTIADPKILLIVEMIQTLINWKEIPTPLLIDILKNEKGNIRFIAAEILGESLSIKGKETFISMLSVNEPLINYYALWGLGRLKDKNAKEKVNKFLSIKNERVKSAAIWYYSCINDKTAYPKALELIKSKDPITRTTALDALYKYHNKDSQLNLNYFLKKNNYNLTWQRIAIILVGIIKDKYYTKTLKNISNEKGINSYYAAESLYRIDGKRHNFNMSYLFPQDFSLYGKNLYSNKDFLRTLLLYLYLNPKDYGNIKDISIGYIIENKYNLSNISLYENPNFSSKILANLYTKDYLFIIGYKGFFAHVLTVDGKNGWIYNKNLNILNDAINNTGRRIRKDYGLRWKSDIINTLNKDYINGSDIKIRYKNSFDLEAFKVTVSLLNWLEHIPYNNEQYEIWEQNLKPFSNGEKIITIKSIYPQKEFNLSFDPSGLIKKIFITK